MSEAEWMMLQTNNRQAKCEVCDRMSEVEWLVLQTNNRQEKCEGCYRI